MSKLLENNENKLIILKTSNTGSSLQESEWLSDWVSDRLVPLPKLFDSFAIFELIRKLLFQRNLPVWIEFANKVSYYSCYGSSSEGLAHTGKDKTPFRDLHGFGPTCHVVQ